MANIYNQSTNLAAMGKFAPGVSYRADIKKPSQPVPDMPDVKETFNIDMSSFAKAVVAYDKAGKAEEAKLLKNAYMNELARELMLNETAVDQGQFDTLTGDRNARTIIDRYLANGAAYGVNADDISGIYPKYGASTFRATQDRLDWADNIREEEQKQYNDYVQAVPAAADLPYAQGLYQAKMANKVGADFAAAMEVIKANPDNESNKMMMYSTGATFGDTQAQTTLSNILSGLKSGQISQIDASEQIRNSVLNSYIKRGVDKENAVHMTNLTMNRMKDTLDTLGQMTKAEYETMELWDKKQALQRKTGMDLLNPDIASLRDSKFPIQADSLPQFAGIQFPSTTFNRETIRGTTTVTDGKTIVDPAHPGNIVSYTDMFGNERQMPAGGYETELDASLYNAVAYDRMPKYLQMSTGFVIPKGGYLSGQVAKETRQVGNASNININGADFAKLSPEDQERVLQNQENFVNNTANNSVYREGLKNNNDTGTEQYIDFKARQMRGNKMIKDGQFGIYRWQNSADFFNNSQFLAKGLVQSEDGHLLLQDDIPGVAESIAQFGSGYKGKEHVQNLNNILDATCPTAEQRKDAIAAWLGNVPVWDGTAGYSAEPTSTESFGNIMGDVSSKAVQATKSGLKKGAAFVAEKATEAVNDEDNQEAVRKMLTSARNSLDELIKNLSPIVKKAEGIKNAYQFRQSAAGGLESSVLKSIEGAKPEVLDRARKALEDVLPAKNAKATQQQVEEMMQQGVSISEALSQSLLQNLPDKDKNKLADEVSKKAPKEKRSTVKNSVKDFLSGAGEGISEAAEYLVENVPFLEDISNAAGAAWGSLEIADTTGDVTGAYNAANIGKGGAVSQGLFTTLLGFKSIGEFAASGWNVLKQIVSAQGVDIKRSYTPSVEPATFINSDELEHQKLVDELTQSGQILLGTESTEYLKQLAEEIKKGR